MNSLQKQLFSTRQWSVDENAIKESDKLIRLLLLLWEQDSWSVMQPKCLWCQSWIRKDVSISHSVHSFFLEKGINHFKRVVSIKTLIDDSCTFWSIMCFSVGIGILFSTTNKTTFTTNVFGWRQKSPGVTVTPGVTHLQQGAVEPCWALTVVSSLTY